MKFKVIFISGVHGVGKGTICNKLSSHLDCPHFTASDLIKSIKNTQIDNNKIVINAEKNQDHLITALENLNLDINAIILDGHFCLQGEKEIVEVPLETFKAMELAAVILLTDEPAEIYNRMYARDNHSLNVNVIEALQNKEIESSQYVTNKLKIPFLQAGINDHKAIAEWIISKVF